VRTRRSASAYLTLGTVAPGLSGWLLISGMSLVLLIVGQVLKIVGVIK
jgi:hypothetical protein